MDNLDHVEKPREYNDNTIPYNDPELRYTPTPQHCISPRGTQVFHNDYIYAYNRRQATVQEACIVERRACVDGVLMGSFIHQECNPETNIVNTATNSSGTVFYYFHPNFNLSRK